MNLNKNQILENLDYNYVYGKYISPNTWKHVKEGWYLASSPFREDKSPSFSFNVTFGAWRDFAEENGDIISFIEKYHRVDFKGALEILSEYAGMKDTVTTKPPKKDEYELKPITAKQITFYNKNLLDHVKPKISDLVFRRSITKETVKKYKVGVNSYFSRKYGCEICEVIIPYKFDESGNAVEYKKIKYDSEGSKTVEKNNDGVSTTVELKPQTKGNAQIFPRDIYKSDTETLILCEGEYDCLVLLSQGIQAITGTAGSGTFTQLMADQLTGKSIIIIYDNDEAGIIGRQTAEKQLKVVAKSVRVADWRYFESVDVGRFKIKDKYDCSDYFGEKREKTDFFKMIESAKSGSDTEVVNTIISDKEDLIGILYEEYEYRKEVCYRLVHQNVVNHIISNKKICSSRIQNKLVFFEYDKGFWNKKEKEDLVRYVARELLYFTTTHIELNQVVSLLGDLTYVNPELFDARLDLVNLENMAYDTVNMMPEPHNPEHYFTCKNSYKYEEKADCPKFMEAVRQYSMNDDKWIDALGEIFGYSLTADYPYQKMFWWYGSGRNGKGTLVRLLDKLVGEEYSMADLNPKTLDGQFDKVDLMGKKIAYNPDMEPLLPNATILKKLTGGDKIRTGRKYLSSASFFNTAKIILLMNGMPDIPSNEILEPIFRRLFLLPFEFKIMVGKENINIESELEEELPGIFNWAIKSLKRLRKNTQFTEVPRGLKILELYKGSANSYMQFFTDMVVFEKGSEVWGHDLWDGYREFMKEHHGSRWFMSQVDGMIKDKISFGKELKKQFSDRYEHLEIVTQYCKETKKNASMYKGLRLKKETDYENYYDIEQPQSKDPWDVQAEEKLTFAEN